MTKISEMVTSNGFSESVLHILHFNDCYNVEPRSQEPVGGAARFVHALHTFDHLKPLVLFSGDIIAPSLMSTITKGEQMLPVLEMCQVQCALFGNHEFDFGLEHLISFANKTNFPWLMSNAFDKKSNKPLGEGEVTHIIEKDGLKIGLIGLIEEEWLCTLVLDVQEILYVDFVVEGRKLAKYLKEQENVDIVIALTHMRTHNDIKLAQNVEEIDLILGGHDHDYDVRNVNGKFIIKSGTDFRQFSKIEINLHSNKIIDIKIEEVNVTSKFGEDVKLLRELEKYKTFIEDKMENVIAYLECDLDGKFSSIRSKETNIGNLITDIILDSVEDADIVLVNSGTFRSDRTHQKGPLKMRDIFTILPFMESIMVLKINGEQIYRALENGVSQYPKLEGRFPQIAGMCFAFDPNKAPYNRVDIKSIKVDGKDLDLQKVYKLATKEFIAQGKDGYDVLQECEVWRSTEECIPLIQAVQEYFQALKLIQIEKNKQQCLNNYGRRQSIINLSRRHSLHADIESKDYVCTINPKVEGRIVNLCEIVKF